MLEALCFRAKYQLLPTVLSQPALCSSSRYFEQELIFLFVGLFLTGILRADKLLPGRAVYFINKI